MKPDIVKGTQTFTRLEIKMCKALCWWNGNAQVNVIHFILFYFLLENACVSIYPLFFPLHMWSSWLNYSGENCVKKISSPQNNSVNHSQNLEMLKREWIRNLENLLTFLGSSSLSLSLLALFGCSCRCKYEYTFWQLLAIVSRHTVTSVVSWLS